MATPAPTLEMVAALAGASRSTVSRVINDSPRVTSDAVEAVNLAIAKLNYVPNRAARALASRKTQAIALVIPENTARFFADPFFASVILGIAMHLAATDYTLSMLIASETDSGKTRRYLQGGNVDGALILSHHLDDRSYTRLATSIPVVFGGRPMSEDGTANFVVDVDNIESASLATRYLIDHGRRRIATIAGRQDMAAGLDRYEGWRRTLEAAGLAADLHEVGDFTPSGGAAAMTRLTIMPTVLVDGRASERSHGGGDRPSGPPRQPAPWPSSCWPAASQPRSYLGHVALGLLGVPADGRTRALRR